MNALGWIAESLRTHAELALFLTLGLGYAIGHLKLGGFKVGPVLGCLLAGVLVGQLGIPVSRDVKYAFFLLFLFAIGENSIAPLSVGDSTRSYHRPCAQTNTRPVSGSSGFVAKMRGVEPSNMFGWMSCHVMASPLRAPRHRPCASPI